MGKTSLCLYGSISPEQHTRTSPLFVHVDYIRVLVDLWWRCDTLCTSGFLDDVMFSQNGLMARRVYS